MKFRLQSVMYITCYVVPYLFAENCFRPEIERIQHFYRTKHVDKGSLYSKQAIIDIADLFVCWSRKSITGPEES
jgi:hypothetical protein